MTVQDSAGTTPTPLSLRDPDGERGKPVTTVRPLPKGGYAVAAAPTAVVLSIARGTRVDATMRAAVDGIGGIGRFVRKGDVALIRPTFVVLDGTPAHLHGARRHLRAAPQSSHRR